MKNKLTILIIGIFCSTLSNCQNPDVGKVCARLDSTLSNNFDLSEQTDLYNKIVAKALTNINDSLHKIFLNNLHTNCQAAITFNQRKKQALSIIEAEPIVNFLSRKCAIEWTSNELDIQINKIQQKHLGNKDFTRKIIHELCKHIDYTEYKLLPEYQQVRILKSLAQHLKNGN